MPGFWDFYKEAANKLGGRKLTLALVIAGVATAVDHFAPGGLSSNMMTLLLGLFGSFTVGNMGEHFAKAKSQNYTLAWQDVKAEAGLVEGEMQDIEASNKELVDAITEQYNTLRKDVNTLAQATQTNSQALQFIVNFCQNVNTEPK